MSTLSFRPKIVFHFCRTRSSGKKCTRILLSNKLSCPALIVGGVQDHVHILMRLNRMTSQSDWVKEVKRVSCTWAKQRDRTLRDFFWQEGFGALSGDASDTDGIRRYIENQEDHHRRVSYKDELLALLKEHDLQWDERYLWD